MFEEVLSAVWHNSSCYVTLTDVRVTWFQAASACAARNGTLASLDVDSTAVKFIRSPFIPIICVWVGLARNYLYWAMPESQYRIRLWSDRHRHYRHHYHHHHQPRRN